MDLQVVVELNARIAALEAENARLREDCQRETRAAIIYMEHLHEEEIRADRLEAALKEIVEYYMDAGIGYSADAVNDIAQRALFEPKEDAI